jgi:hypothetical protein
MTTKVPWQYAGKKQTTPATTGDQALDGSWPQEVLDALRVSQIVKQLKGDYAVNSEIIQKVTTSYLQDVEEDNAAAVGRAACEANRAYYQSLADKARASHQEYLQAVELWQNKLNKISKTLD